MEYILNQCAGYSVERVLSLKTLFHKCVRVVSVSYDMPSVLLYVNISWFGGKVELPLLTRHGPRWAINTQDNNHFLQAPCSKVLLPKDPEGLRGVIVARGPGSPLRARRKATFEACSWNPASHSEVAGLGWVWLSWIRHSALMLYAVSTHLLEIKTINPFCIRKIGEGQLPSLIILNIRKLTKKCSFSSYGKQYDSFSHR